MRLKILADENIPFVRECFGSLGQVEVVAAHEITVEKVQDAEVLIVRSVTKVGQELLSGSSVQFVGTATIGFDHVDVEFLQQGEIGFASAPGSNANSVAEYVVAGLLEVGAKYDLKLEGKSIGVVGVGNVGSRVAAKCEALGMRAYLNDPPLQRQTQDAKYRRLEELFDCDIVTVHTPLTFEGEDKTYHLADKRFFGSLKEGCVFVNTARGAVADTEALQRAALEQLMALHRIGRLAAHVGAEKLDGDVGAFGLLTNEIDQYTAAVGRTYAQAGLVPPGWKEVAVPPPKKWILGVALGGVGLVGVTALLLWAASRPRRVEVQDGERRTV